MKTLTPPFTKRLFDGAAVAEDPGSGESFGLHRCGLIADGLLTAAPSRSMDDVLAAIVESFRLARISLEAPYLNPGSVDDGELSFDEELPKEKGRPIRSRVVQTGSTASWLDCAAQIGRRICDEALWDSERCAWMSYINPDETIKNQPQSLSPLGPELYQGSAGIGLFLSLLYSETGDKRVRRTALGAIKHSLSRLSVIDARRALGLFDGRLGIAFASAVAGELINSDELIFSSKAATDMALHGWQNEADAIESDFFSGFAGAIVTLLLLEEIISDESLISSAFALGESLVSAGTWCGETLSWKSQSPGANRNLLGFSHGTAGIACALLELWRRVGVQEFKNAALGALEYERHWFDAERGNWPDFRVDDDKKGKERLKPRFINAWCHGAPGIALSRCRAYEVLHNEDLAAEARTALQTTSSSVLSSLGDSMPEFCLCHGLAGNADVLLSCRTVQTDFDAVSSRRLAESAAERIFESGISAKPRFGRSGHSAGDTPGLMLGRAGLGWFFLRLNNDSIQSILAVKPGFVTHSRAS